MRLDDLREDAITHNTVVAINKYKKEIRAAYQIFKFVVNTTNYNDAAAPMWDTINRVQSDLWMIKMLTIGDKKIEAAYNSLQAEIKEITDRLECGI